MELQILASVVPVSKQHELEREAREKFSGFLQRAFDFANPTQILRDDRWRCIRKFSSVLMVAVLQNESQLSLEHNIYVRLNKIHCLKKDSLQFLHGHRKQISLDPNFVLNRLVMSKRA